MNMSGEIYDSIKASSVEVIRKDMPKTDVNLSRIQITT